MGYRLHARKINRVEYGDVAAFNGSCMDDIRRMVFDFSEDIWESEDESELEMPKADFKAGIEAVRKMSDEDFAEEYQALVKEGYSKSTVVALLSGLLAEADPDNDEIYLDWF